MTDLNVNSNHSESMPQELAAQSRSELTEIRYRKASGESVTEAEQSLLQEARRKYEDARVQTYPSEALKQQWTVSARAQGMSLSSWVIARVIEACQGPGELELRYRGEISKLRDEVTSLRGWGGDLSVENSALRAELKDLTENRLARAEADLTEALETANGLLEKIRGLE